MSESLVALKDVLRRYPDVAHVCVGHLGGDSGGGSGGGLAVYGGITEPAARAAYVWMLGHFGGLIQVRRAGATGDNTIPGITRPVAGVPIITWRDKNANSTAASAWQ